MLKSEQQKQIWDRLWSHEVSYDWDSLSQTIYEKIVQITGEVQGKEIVEAGSGTGKISLRLAAERAKVTLVDYSQNALENSRSAFHQTNLPATFILSDIQNMLLPDQHFDLTWNAGVLEHFEEDERVVILKEMRRVTKPDGIVVVLTPYALCLPYRAGKEAGEELETWMYGTEYPITSLQDEFERSGLTLIEEHSIGFLNSLDFLDFIENSASVKQWLTAWYHSLDEQEQRQVPGYLLVSVGQPKDASSLSIARSNLPKDQELSSEERLKRAQAIISTYHDRREHSHYLSAYRAEETTYWLPLLPILDSLLTVKGSKVLDIGSAYGTLLMYSVLTGARGFGLDMMPDYWSRELEADYGLSFSLCNVEADPLPGHDIYDIILFTEVLEHMNYNPIPVLRKINERLMPGGSLLISTPWKRHFAPDHAYPRLEEMPYYKPGDTFIDAEIRYYSIDEMYVLAHSSDFQVRWLDVYNGHLLSWFIKP